MLEVLVIVVGPLRADHGNASEEVVPLRSHVQYRHATHGLARAVDPAGIDVISVFLHQPVQQLPRGGVDLAGGHHVVRGASALLHLGNHDDRRILSLYRSARKPHRGAGGCNGRHGVGIVAARVFHVDHQADVALVRVQYGLLRHIDGIGQFEVLVFAGVFAVAVRRLECAVTDVIERPTAALRKLRQDDLALVRAAGDARAAALCAAALRTSTVRAVLPAAASALASALLAAGIPAPVGGLLALGIVADLVFSGFDDLPIRRADGLQLCRARDHAGGVHQVLAGEHVVGVDLYDDVTARSRASLRGLGPVVDIDPLDLSLVAGDTVVVHLDGRFKALALHLQEGVIRYGICLFVHARAVDGEGVFHDNCGGFRPL